MQKTQRTITDIYNIEQKLDEGAFGHVYRAKNRDTGDIVAIKRFKQQFNRWNDCISLNEVRYLKDLNHPNVIKLREIIKEKGELFLIYEYADTNLLKFYSYYRKKVMLKEATTIRKINYEYGFTNSKGIRLHS